MASDRITCLMIVIIVSAVAAIVVVRWSARRGKEADTYKLRL